MIDAPLAIAFTAGMVATFNPCGFAMLPAYLGTFMGLEDDTTDTGSRILRALAVGGSLTLGFVVVFGLLGVGLSSIESVFEVSLEEKLPYVTIVIGIGLVGLGIALLAGKHLTVALPKLEKGTRGTELGSMFLFGVSYAIASLSCTMPVFLALVSQTFSRDSFLDGVAVYLAYALGMGLVLMVLTLLMALAKASLVHSMKRVLPVIDRIAGGLLVLAGAYVAYYGWYEIQVFSGNLDAGGPAEYFFELNGDVNEWIDRVGATNLGLVLGAVVVGALLIALGMRADRRAGRLGPSSPEASGASPGVGDGRTDPSDGSKVTQTA